MFRYPLNESTIQKISKIKKEPNWMLDYRLQSYTNFLKLKLPKWGPDLSAIDFENMEYFLPGEATQNNWKQVPKEILTTFEQIGVPEREREYLAGVSTQYDSEIIYSRVKKHFEEMGIVFQSIENGLKNFPKLFQKYFGQLISNDDNKFAALNSAFWSGGSFVYIPKDVKIDIPIETYFRINAKALGQFERTLIIADEGSSVHYIEGCTAPQYLETSIHAGVVEIFALKGAHVTYTTLQNWSTNVYNLVTKRAIAKENAFVEWVDCNIGSRVTMKYPAVILEGAHSQGTLTSLALAGKGQEIDSGGKMIHIGDDTKSIIRSKTICTNGGVGTYRGMTKFTEQSMQSRAYIDCESLLLDSISQSNAFPDDTVCNYSNILEHEATISSISQAQLEYLSSKGLSETEARDLIVQGFASSILEQLPDEYSLELNRILYHFVQPNEKNRF